MRSGDSVLTVPSPAAGPSWIAEYLRELQGFESDVSSESALENLAAEEGNFHRVQILECIGYHPHDVVPISTVVMALSILR